MNEQAAILGRTNPLISVVSDPDQPGSEPPGTAFVFLNAGLAHHVGPDRPYVSAARRLAAAAFAVLRFHFSGIREGPVRADHLPLDKSTGAAVRQAMQRLAAARPVEGLVLLGLCSGATFAPRAAGADHDGAGVALINFRGGINREARSYLSRRAWAGYSWPVPLLSARSWGKLLTGKAACRAWPVPLRPRSETRAGAAGGELRRPRATGNRMPRLLTLVERGTRVPVVYSAGGPGWDCFRMALGAWTRAVDASPTVGLEPSRGRTTASRGPRASDGCSNGSSIGRRDRVVPPGAGGARLRL